MSLHCIEVEDPSYLSNIVRHSTRQEATRLDLQDPTIDTAGSRCKFSVMQSHGTQVHIKTVSDKSLERHAAINVTESPLPTRKDS